MRPVPVIAVITFGLIVCGCFNGFVPTPEPNPKQNPDPNPAPIPDPIPDPDPNPAPQPDPNPNPNPDPNPNPNPNPAPGPEIQGRDEIAFIEAMCRGARDTRTIGSARTVNAVYNVFSIGNLTGYFPVGSGTLSLDQFGSAVSYDANPADHLVTVSPTETIEYFYEGFSGDTSGVLSFVNNHSSLIVRVRKQGSYDIRITSAASATGTQRHYVGSVQLPRGTVNVDIVDADGTFFDFVAQRVYLTGYDFAGLDFASTSSLQGVVQAVGGRIDVTEFFKSRIVNTVQETRIGVASIGQLNGANYAMGNVYFQQVERDGLPTEPDFWLAQGQILRDDVPLGMAQFIDSPNPITDPTPERVMVLIDGTRVGL